jgi:drug/metabolite transporter (DMT)-like permease
MVQKIKQWVGVGPLSMIGAGLAFSVMSAFVKAASVHIPIFQITFFRAAVSAVIILIATKLKGIRLKGENQKILLVRSLSGFTSMCLNFYALSQINLGDASVLHQTTPFFVILFSVLLLGEKLYRPLLLITLVCFAGISVVLRPSGHLFNYGGMAALTSAVFAAGAYVSIRHLHKTDSFWTMSFYFMATAAVLSAPPMVTNWVNPTGREWLLLVGTGLTGTLGQLWMTYSYKHEHASFVAPFAYAGVLFSFLWGVWFFNEVPTVLTLLGAGLTAGGAIGILLVKKGMDPPLSDSGAEIPIEK